VNEEADEALLETARSYDCGNATAGDVRAAALRYAAALLRAQGSTQHADDLEAAACVVESP
jgi:hypothetical protein